MRRYPVFVRALLVVAVGSGTLTASAMGLWGTVGRQQDGSVTVPTNQIVFPAGRQVEFGGRPSAVALHPDGRTAAFLTAYADKPIVVVDVRSGRVVQHFGPGDETPPDGILYAPDGRHLYASLASGKLLIARVGTDGTLALESRMTLPQIKSVGDPLPSGMALSADGQTLYVVLTATTHWAWSTWPAARS